MKPVKHIRVWLALAAFFCGVACAADFTGDISVSVDTAVPLKVWINGECKGETPFVLNDVPVGNYNLSFIDPGLRDSILANSSYPVSLEHPGLAALPPMLRSLIEKNPKKGLPLLARYSNYSIIVQNGKNEEVVFEAAGFARSFQDELASGKIKYVLLAVGALGVGAFIFIQVTAF